MSQNKCLVAVLNWNGSALLAQCLPSVVRAAQAARSKVDVAVIDNGSDDDSLNVLTEFPDVLVIGLGRNLRMLAYNDVLARVDYDYVLLLNNDIQLDAGAIDPLLDALTADANCFAAVPRLVNPDGSGSAFPTVLQWYRGMPIIRDRRGHSPYTFFAPGGAALFRRTEFLMLGGYRALYHPFYWEDVALSYCAWKAGYTVRWVSNSKLIHLGSATLSRRGFAPGRYLEANKVRFAWAQVSDPARVLHAVLSLPYVVARAAFWACFKHETDLCYGLVDAIRSLPAIRDERRWLKSIRSFTDYHVSSIVGR